MRGIFIREQLDEVYTTFWVPSRRYGIKQGQKDDFSAFLDNLSTMIGVEITLRGIHDVVSIARSMKWSVKFETKQLS